MMVIMKIMNGISVLCATSCHAFIHPRGTVIQGQGAYFASHLPALSQQSHSHYYNMGAGITLEMNSKEMYYALGS